MLLFLTFMYKTMGGYTWSGLWLEPPEPFPVDESPITRTPMDRATEAAGETVSLAWQSVKQVRK